MLSRASLCCRLVPCSSAALSAHQPKQHQFSNPLHISRRHLSLESMLSSVQPIMQPWIHYASESPLTEAVQSGMEALHTTGLPWAGVMVGTAILLRLFIFPIHLKAERLYAESIHARNVFAYGIIKKVAKKYGVEFQPNKEGTKLVVGTNNEEIIHTAEKLVNTHMYSLLLEQGLSGGRIMCLKAIPIPVWVFSSSALRNIISADFHQAFPGALWVADFLQPDPYYILPILVGVFGYLNFWAQRKIFPVQSAGLMTNSYDYLLGLSAILAVVVMSNLPACIPFYWLMVSATGFAQTQVLRIPRLKKLLNIRKLPSDSATPLRDLFLMRRSV